MAYKLSPNSLIHCDECGEDYSATYKRCPFCGAKNEPPQPNPERSTAPSDLEDTYVFEGQELFDGEEEDYAANSKGGKRLADKPLSNPFANPDINWPRVITFVCSLVIIVAAMIIVFTVIYPQLRGNPTADNSQAPSLPASDPGSNTSQNPDPSAAITDEVPSDPVTEPPASTPPSVSSGLTALSFNRANDSDFTLKAGESHTIKLNFSPASWSGTVTWTSTDTTVATVDANGKVTNVNTSGKLRSAVITAAAGGLTLESKVYCRSGSATAATQPPATQPPASAPPASDPPASAPPASDPPTTQPPSSSGTVTVGKKGVIANTGPGRGSGVIVREQPSTSGKKLASLFNGDPITVLEDAGNGWYKISNGPTQGYIKGDYLSTD